MLIDERYNKILQILSEDGSAKTSYLAEILDVSLETIRRDLDYLSSENLIKKIHGGAISKNSISLSYFDREDKNIEEKREMAKIAIRHIKDNETIALNSSTTNFEIAKLIKGKNLTVITNSFPIANELIGLKNISLILAGGIYSDQEYGFLGDMTAKFLDNFSIDKAFITVGGISLKRGATDNLIDEVAVESKMIEISNQTIFLADATKIESNSLIKVCDISNIKTIITDSNLDDEIKKRYNSYGIDIKNGK